ncbi:MAG: hypothetical protein GC185_08685 [Alphaproteobacteria bacterium]|nr:hypothetical protein [Alphaproteobacteria bacterium]
MGKFRDVFHEKIEKAMSGALADSVEMVVKEINAIPPGFTPPRFLQISDRALNALIRDYCEEMPGTKKTEGQRRLKINIRAMREGARFRGQFEGRIMPLLDGLTERGGMVNGEKIALVVDKKEFHAEQKFAAPPRSVLSR